MLNLGFRCVVPGLLALCLPLALALPNGAPISSCGTMAPVHNNIVPQNSSSPHSINASSVNGTMQVRIMGPIYKGLLLQARKPNESTAVGTWSSPPANTKTIALRTYQAALKVQVQNISCQGELPMCCHLATVAQGRSVYWLGVTSNEIMMNCDGNGAVRTTSGLVLVLIWPLLFWLHSEG